MLQGSVQWLSRVFERSSKGILEKFQRCVKEVSRVFKESFRVVQGSSKVVSREFQGGFKKVS